MPIVEKERVIGYKEGGFKVIGGREYNELECVCCGNKDGGFMEEYVGAKSVKCIICGNREYRFSGVGIGFSGIGRGMQRKYD